MFIPAIVSVSPREAEIHRRAFASINGAGFSVVHASCEPGTTLRDPISGVAKLHAERRGQWRNFIEALKIGLSTDSKYFVTLEDDVELCRGTADLIDRAGWPAPDCGCVQLYSAAPLSVYPVGRRSQLSTVHALDLLGACALLFRRDAASILVEWADTKGWRGDTTGIIDDPAEKKAADTFVGEVLTFHRMSIWSHNPSLANHIGDASTLGHTSKSVNPLLTENPNRKPLNFPGIDADLNAIFSEELRCAS